jgi:RHS repeat-associated protein
MRGGCARRNYPFLTQKERDNETELDYFLARYYSSKQGRFTSPDEFTGGPLELFDFSGIAQENPTFYADLTQPQSLNKYQYCLGSPLSYLDPDGHQQAATQRIMVEQGGYLARISAAMGRAYDSALNGAIDAKNKVVGFRAKLQKALGTDRDSLIEISMRGGLPRESAERIADQSMAFNDSLLMGPTKGAKFAQQVEARLISQGYKVTRGDDIGEGMADFLGVLGNKGIVREATTSASKSLSQTRKQLQNGFDHLTSKGLSEVRIQVEVNSQRAAARLRKELGKVRDHVVEIIVNSK